MTFYFFNGTNDQPKTAILLSIEKDIHKLCFVELGELICTSTIGQLLYVKPTRVKVSTACILSVGGGAQQKG